MQTRYSLKSRSAVLVLVQQLPAVKMAGIIPSFWRRKRAHWVALFVTSASSFHLAPVWMPSQKMVTTEVETSLRMTSSAGNMNRAHFVRSCSAATVGGAAALTLAPRSSSATTASHVVRALRCELGWWLSETLRLQRDIARQV